MDEQNGASIEKNEETLLTDAKPQPEDFEEASRYDNETTSTRDSDDKSSDIINKSDVSDKKEGPEMFTNGSGTRVDKNTTYSSVTDENAHGKTSTMDVYVKALELDNTKSKVSECKEVIDVITDGRELAEPTAANDSVVQLRNNEQINRLEIERALEYLSDQFYSFLISSKDKSSITEALCILESNGIFPLDFLVQKITSTSGKLSNHHEKPPDATDKPDTPEESLVLYDLKLYIPARWHKILLYFKPLLNKLIPQISSSSTESIVFILGTLFRKLTNQDRKEIGQHHRTSRGTQTTGACSNKRIVGAASQSLELDSEKNNVDKFCHGSEELSIGINTTTSDIQPTTYDNNQLNDNIQIDTDESNQLYEDKDLPNTKITKITKQCESNEPNEDKDFPKTKITKITKQSVADCVLDETITCINEILEMIKNNQPCILEELEFHKSELKIEQLEEFLKKTLRDIACEISKLSIGFTKHVTDLIPSYCKIASKYKTSKLSLIFDDLKNEDIESLLRNLAKNDRYTELDISYNRDIGSGGYENVGKIVKEHDVETLKLAGCDISDDDLQGLFDGMGDAKSEKFIELDMNHNKNIESAGYENVGKIVQKHEVRKLRLADCDISDDDLRKLFDGMGDAKLEVLDISCTNNLTTEGFRCIGKQVAQKRIKMLKLSDTQLNVEALTAFHKEVADSIEDSESQQVLLEEIDVSYNSTMEPEAYKVLGSMVKLFGVKKLSLAACGLRKEHLENFREEMNSENSIKETGQHTKMKYLNAGYNTSIGKGIVEIAKIVKECLLEELDISECGFSPIELKGFIEALEEAKLKCLYLGEKRQFNKNYISQVCNLLPSITETLRLKGTVRNQSRSMLQKKLDTLTESKLEIKLDDDATLRAREA